MSNETITSIAYSDTSQIDDKDIAKEFLKVDLPSSAFEDIKSFSDRIDYPIAIRSSSLLEDSQHQPFEEYTRPICCQIIIQIPKLG